MDKEANKYHLGPAPLVEWQGEMHLLYLFPLVINLYASFWHHFNLFCLDK